MTSVAPPPPPQLLQIQAAPPPVVAISNPPAALAALLPGARIEAILLAVQNLPPGTFQAETPFGLLTFQTSAPLPKTGALTFQLLTAGPEPQLQLTSINGRAPGLTVRPAAPGGLASDPGVAGGTTPAVQPADSASTTVGSTVPATLIRPFPGLPGTPVVSTGLPGQGGIALPPPLSAGLPGTAAPAPPSGQTAPAPATGPAMPATASPEFPAAPSSSATAGNTFPPGTQVTVRVASVTPPATGTGPASLPASSVPSGGAGLTAGATLQGTVTGTTAAGQAMVQTPAGVLALELRSPLPPGTRVVLEVIGDPLVPRFEAAAVKRGPEALLQGREWGALVDTLQVLHDLNPGLSQHFLATAVPRADSQLAAHILGFMTALRGGDVRAWLGDGVARTLARNRPDILERLDADFSEMGRLAKDDVVPDWRVNLVPFWLDSGIEQLRILTRRARGDDEGRGEGGTRFVVDLSLSRMGRLQIDGLVKRHGRQVDLMLRSDRPLPPPVREEIRAIFRETAEVTGITGGIGFQASPPNFVEIAPADGDHDHLGLVV